ncbi:hypothetical protein GCM10011360_09000 [Primorskyibacter flagellatus]|uniref:Uncharacterized protein n=1 Tax=Primorskyibacter flagellatus TaxID=1387277 RepID=A0A917A1V7_9RHOB|nr:hypothetical protein [Primorskyibacter flagellatus]GGE22710.1 hypothetical protein GCM10011360_09000 [Primorskyibacter flagellatus]
MFRRQSLLTRAIWAALVLVAAEALITGRLSLAFIAMLTLGLSMVPVYVARWAEVEVPPGFMLAVVAFVGGTIFLGEVFDFYNRFWWWDIAMHGGSAIGFGLTGFVLVFMMFQGDRFAAPPSAIAFFAFCFALAIGAMWEVFEFAMDQSFGTNMQKSGLMDTMGDLIVDMGGALIGAGSGYAYLRGRALGGLTGTIEYFVSRNPRLFRKWRK